MTFKFREMSVRQRAVLAHGLGAYARDGVTVPLTQELFEELLDADYLPSVPERCDNLLESVGASSHELGALVTFRTTDWRARIGALGTTEIDELLRHLESRGLIRQVGDASRRPPDVKEIALTLDGQIYIDELRRNRPQSRRAFVALPFDNPDVLKVLNEAIRPACRAAGFTAFKLDDETPAGLIDNRMRVEIRRARFLIAELTESNPGAYWEAGFAEGLGKPVIYLCDQRYFKGKPPHEGRSVHFDVNHHQHVLWHPDELPRATTLLTAAIRATLPGEAVLED